MAETLEIPSTKSPIDITREIVLSSLESFTKYFQVEYEGYGPNLYPYQIRITDKLDEVTRCEILRLNINLPPRYRKTHLAVKYWVAYCMAKTAGRAKFIHLSYSKSLALDNSEAIKDLITSDEFTRLFPEVQIKKDSKAKEKWYTTAGGGVYATSSGGQVTGFGAGSSPEEYEAARKESEKEEAEAEKLICEFLEGWDPSEKFGGAIIIDDANKPEDADSPLMLKKVNDRFDSTIKNRVNSRYTPIINIQQRIAPKDLSGHLQAQKDKDGNPIWENLILSAIDENGDALCEAIHTKEELLQIKKENPHIFACQYDQKPKALHGLMYKPFRKVNADRETVLNGAEFLFSSTDANMTTGNDYFVTWFWAVWNGKPFIYDVIMEEIAAKDLKETTVQKHEANRTQMAVIELNNQQTFIAEIETKLKCPVLPVTSRKNKLSRMIAKSHLSENVGFISWYGEDPSPQYIKAINHMEAFNRNGKSEDGKDDPEDAFTLGLDYLWTNYQHIFTT